MTMAQEEERPWGGLSDLPGHPMMWVLILTEVVTFGLLFVAFSVAGAVQPALFAAGRAQLDPLLGGANTLVLITSGWLAALAVEARLAERRGAARALLAGAMALGLLFAGLKLVEYTGKAQAGIGLETDTFFTLYFLLTGFHLLHVLLGIVILATVAIHDSADNLKTGTAFWHMVDLVWVVMYPLVYLIG
ncbi:cytochrome c oxidase subunit 3 [Microvirga thermotolerans]|uniref:Cytochrome c oxidase subunit 3 family protein n=1 Tax=Microvirga thermotolerans TaxID=2651334 RepID=A0A5P9JR42_9HYPH|nr:cytochrome c oxidase subunit 3 [Microvirga thermotolerans]QFU14823.1 cytochrome c oxidase subunit 3 family protein [Microvirga thermotolerans]